MTQKKFTSINNCRYGFVYIEFKFVEITIYHILHGKMLLEICYRQQFSCKYFSVTYFFERKKKKHLQITIIRYFHTIIWHPLADFFFYNKLILWLRCIYKRAHWEHTGKGHIIVKLLKLHNNYKMYNKTPNTISHFINKYIMIIYIYM